MSNLERFQLYCKDFKSPDIFIEFGFYALISAILQRRVWRGSLLKPFFANSFTFFVAPPAVGKGQLVEEIEKILKHKSLRMTDEDLSKDKLFGTMQKKKMAEKNGSLEYPPLIFCGPNSTTYEFMVFDMAQNTKTVFYDDPNNSSIKKLYMHSSVCYCLDELGSLFRKNMDDLVLFLLQAYNCGDYKKSILSRAEDDIRNCCLNLIAAAQPSFIRKIMSQDLLDNGFASRVFFVYADKPRHYRNRPPVFEQEQIQAHADLLVYLRQLCDVFGEVKFTDAASDYLDHWSETTLVEQIKFVPERLQSIHARKSAGAAKLAMAIHYGEKLDNIVTLEECQKAVKAIESLDTDMLRCFQGQAKNPLDDVTKDIKSFIRAKTKEGGVGTNAILMEYFRDLPEGKKSLDEIINYLLATGQITVDGNKYREKKG